MNSAPTAKRMSSSIGVGAILWSYIICFQAALSFGDAKACGFDLRMPIMDLSWSIFRLQTSGSKDLNNWYKREEILRTAHALVTV